jgi:hypothetical protein
MNSVFELLIKVWAGSRDLKVLVSLDFNFFFLVANSFSLYNIVFYADSIM